MLHEPPDLALDCLSGKLSPELLQSCVGGGPSSPIELHAWKQSVGGEKKFALDLCWQLEARQITEHSSLGPSRWPVGHLRRLLAAGQMAPSLAEGREINLHA